MLYQGNTLLTNEGGINESDLNLRLQDFKNSLNIDAKLEEFKNSLTLETADNIFIATYGVTTNAEIETAYNTNKWIFAIYAGRFCPLATRNSETKHYFISNAGTGAIQLTCLNNEWSYQTISYADQSHGSTHAPSGSDPIEGYSKIVTGSYVGTGKGGTEGTVTLTFNFIPKVLMIFSATGTQFPGNGMFYASGSTTTTKANIPAIGYPQALTTTFATGLFVSEADYYSKDLLAKRSEDGKTISWYHPYTNPNTDNEQILNSYGVYALNGSGTTYHYVAIG